MVMFWDRGIAKIIHIQIVETIVELCNIHKVVYWTYLKFSQCFLIIYFLACDFILHTSKFITRIYPKAIRADSSNFNPQQFWNVGCQMGMLYRILSFLQR